MSEHQQQMDMLAEIKAGTDNITTAISQLAEAIAGLVQVMNREPAAAAEVAEQAVTKAKKSSAKPAAAPEPAPAPEINADELRAELQRRAADLSKTSDNKDAVKQAIAKATNGKTIKTADAGELPAIKAALEAL